MLISHWDNFPTALAMWGLMCKWLLDVLHKQILILNAKLPSSLGTFLNFVTKKGGKENRKEEATEIPNSRFFNSLLQSTKSMPELEEFLVRENTADIFWRIVDLSSCKMKVKRCAGQHFLLHPSPDIELPGTSLLLELLRAQTWKPNPATTPTLQLFLDTELHVTPNLHPCSMISLSELSQTLKKPWTTSYDSTTS